MVFFVENNNFKREAEQINKLKINDLIKASMCRFLVIDPPRHQFHPQLHSLNTYHKDQEEDETLLHNLQQATRWLDGIFLVDGKS